MAIPVASGTLAEKDLWKVFHLVGCVVMPERLLLCAKGTQKDDDMMHVEVFGTPMPDGFTNQVIMVDAEGNECLLGPIYQTISREEVEELGLQWWYATRN